MRSASRSTLERALVYAAAAATVAALGAAFVYRDAIFGAPGSPPARTVDSADGCDEDRSFTGCLARAQDGDARAQLRLARAYDLGDGVPEDNAAAAQWYRRAAEQGHVEAQHALAWLYERGEGVAKDHVEALRWFKLAAAEGLASAQYNLGVAYASGDGVKRDAAEAVRWYRLAADQGDADAQNNLALMYDNGDGVPQDDREAVRWYRAAAARGNVNAQHNLGLMYANAEGVVRDDARAYLWLEVAAAGAGRALDQSAIEALAAQLAPPALAEAQRRAATCRASGFKDCGEPAGP